MKQESITTLTIHPLTCYKEHFFEYHLAEIEKTCELGVSDTLFMDYEKEGWDTLMKTEQKQRVEKCFSSERLGSWWKAGWRQAARGHRSGSNPLQGVCVCVRVIHTSWATRCVRWIVGERQFNQNTTILIAGLTVDLQQLNHEKYFLPFLLKRRVTANQKEGSSELDVNSYM